MSPNQNREDRDRRSEIRGQRSVKSFTSLRETRQEIPPLTSDSQTSDLCFLAGKTRDIAAIA